MADVRVFFRDEERWRSNSNPIREPELAEIISDRDVTNLYDLSMCIVKIRKKAKDEKRKTVYDNQTLENFMDEFTLMINEISRTKNIRNYIARKPRPTFEISTPVIYKD